MSVLIQSLDYVSYVYSWSSFESNSKLLTAARPLIAMPVWKTLSLSDKLSALKKIQEESSAQKYLTERYGISVVIISRIRTNKAKLQ